MRKRVIQTTLYLLVGLVFACVMLAIIYGMTELGHILPTWAFLSFLTVLVLALIWFIIYLFVPEDRE